MWYLVHFTKQLILRKKKKDKESKVLLYKETNEGVVKKRVKAREFARKGCNLRLEV
ncbi:hypothetical protein Fmac_031846 [Flemingia macrophylla]|uniref:Uncharacterized protein n=1 Tax=Flemingia macrophylla TaxID=520843 RepID=A0ABD1L378_9FABA